jgi:hypothetical protein
MLAQGTTGGLRVARPAVCAAAPASGSAKRGGKARRATQSGADADMALGAQQAKKLAVAAKIRSAV